MLRYCTGCFNLLLFKWCKLANTEIWANPRWGHQFFGHMNRFFFFFLLSPPLQRLNDEKCLQIVSYHECGCFSTQMSTSISLQKKATLVYRLLRTAVLDKWSIIPLRCPAASCDFYANHPSVVKPRLSCSPEAAQWHISKSFRSWRRGQTLPTSLRRRCIASPPPLEWGVPQIQSTFPPGSSGGHERPHVRDHISGEDTQRNHAFINNTSKSIFSLEMSCMERKTKHQPCCFVLPFNKCWMCLQWHPVAARGIDPVHFCLGQIIRNNKCQEVFRSFK